VTLEYQNALVLGSLFQFGELATFLDALPTSFAATGKGLDLGMLILGLSELVARAHKRRCA